ncbi:MAG: hypothetical protein RMJ07_03445 [Nitrososphaerota archaeon]|nr:hypothetical protein [Candidatus Bathyarchaeota archaeon]MDW8048717.1 hypothetical protein [Nitrososphaerota archaeon]
MPSSTQTQSLSINSSTFAVKLSNKNQSGEEHYKCRHCHHLTPKKDAIISGYDSEHSLRHIHCQCCGRIIAWPTNGTRIRSALEGIFLTITGGTLAFLLYPYLNVYGLQIGLYTSVFGIIKAAIL